MIALISSFVKGSFPFCTIPGAHCDHRNRNVSQCPFEHFAYVAFSFILHVEGRSARTADTGTQHCGAWIVSELIACSDCRPMSAALIAFDSQQACVGEKGV